MAQEQTKFLKVSVLHFRDQSRDEAEWKKWYLEEQIPRFVPVAHKHGIDRLEVYFTPTALKEMFQADLDTFKGGCAAGWNMAPYDATIMYWVDDPQKVRNMLNDPDWNDKVIVFEKGWINQTKVEVQVGTQTTFIEEGKIVNITETKSY
ncbi:hypothetical protein B0T17DRAFT_538111 [Bombardia bombarda]|uniref:EthD domain-containing protein n=1 Tax=Bombardia bombarda TaxID=252184 RepID=A0AA39WNI5_9PEZI|nr:hypothetical protein B0T17DRAFT_538111 [Bombardia bombarda]